MVHSQSAYSKDKKLILQKFRHFPLILDLHIKKKKHKYKYIFLKNPKLCATTSQLLVIFIYVSTHAFYIQSCRDNVFRLKYRILT